MSPDTVMFLAALVKILIVVGFVVNIAAVLSWADRRQSAMMQDRVGPNRADVNLFGKKITLGGMLHPVADALKMIFKEDFIPPKADKLLHALAPILSLFPPIVLMAVVPFTDTLCLSQIKGKMLSAVVDRYGTCSTFGEVGGYPAISGQVVDINVGILFVFALSGMGVVGATIAGWSSDNKFSLLGGLRAASQLVSYEVAMGLSLIGCMMTYGTLRFDEMARWQGENVWGIFVQPLGFVLFLVAAIAESKRTPFDLPEGESEIVAGYLLEYSGMKFGMFYMGEYIEFATSSVFLVAIFLGGYNMPFLHRDGITMEIGGQTFYHLALPHLFVIVLQMLAFFGKVVVVCFLQTFFRWTLPRFRYDQLMMLGWRVLLPASLVNIFITGVTLLAVNRASFAFKERLKAFGDVINFGVVLLITGLTLWVVIGFFLPSSRTRIVNITRASTSKNLGEASVSAE